MKPKILFLHGFMGATSDGHFLEQFKEYQLITAKVPHKKSINLEVFFDHLDSLRPDLIYGYSLGGRIALRYCHERRPQIKKLLLESVSFGLEDDKARADRLLLDQQRAKDITHDLKAFLNNWYAMPIWGNLSDKQRVKLVGEKMARWEGLEQDLASTILYYSPGTFPYYEPIQIPIDYFYGEQDNVYKQKAADLTFYKNISCHQVSNVGHCIHQSHRLTELIAKIKKALT